MAAQTGRDQGIPGTGGPGGTQARSDVVRCPPARLCAVLAACGRRAGGSRVTGERCAALLSAASLRNCTGSAVPLASRFVPPPALPSLLHQPVSPGRAWRARAPPRPRSLSRAGRRGRRAPPLPRPKPSTATLTRWGAHGEESLSLWRDALNTAGAWRSQPLFSHCPQAARSQPVPSSMHYAIGCAMAPGPL